MLEFIAFSLVILAAVVFTLGCVVAIKIFWEMLHERD